MWRFGLMVLLLMLALPAAAQTPDKISSDAPSETVTVNGQKLSPDQVIDNFVKTYAAPTFYLGKMARWAADICPKVSGLDPRVNEFVARRIKDVAAKAGAHVAAKPDCKTNVEVVFTPEPQAFMDDIRKNHVEMLGNVDNSPSKAALAATISHPVQAWYTTQIRDAQGEVQPEQNYEHCVESRGGVISPQMNERNLKQYYDEIALNARLCGITGKSSLIANGISAEFSNVLIVADTGKLPGIAMASLADYIAMLSLSQNQTFGACQGLSTIANLLTENCATKPAALTDSDAAYLKALYAIDPDEFADFQRGDIARRMEKSLAIP